MAAVLHLLAVAVAFAGTVSAYSSGPPTSVCGTMVPSHGVNGQASASPYVVETTASSGYVPGNTYKITIKKSNSASPNFKGFLCQVRDASSNVVGSFENFDTNKAKNLACTSSKGAVEHKNANLVSSFEADWKAPSAGAGSLTAYCTVVQVRITFWVQVHSQVMMEIIPANPPTNKTATVAATTMKATVKATMKATTMKATVNATMKATMNSTMKATTNLTMKATTKAIVKETMKATVKSTKGPTSGSVSVHCGQQIGSIVAWVVALLLLQFMCQ
eukprot:m.307114 g.307114  ORF g.307114 m.307114 type:complete len:275 (+) comp41916_c0_seq1:89-913(+)